MVSIYLNDSKQKIYSTLAQKVALYYLSNDTKVEIFCSKLMEKYNGQHLDMVKTQNITIPVLLKSRPILVTFGKTPIIRSLK